MRLIDPMETCSGGEGEVMDWPYMDNESLENTYEIYVFCRLLK